jgi:hypothetical protein
VLDVAPDVARGVKHRRLLIYLEVHNLNNHRPSSWVQGNGKIKNKAETCHRQSTKTLSENVPSVWVSYARCPRK